MQLIMNLGVLGLYTITGIPNFTLKLWCADEMEPLVFFAWYTRVKIIE